MDQMVILFFNFLRNCRTLFIMAAPVYIPTHSAQWFQFLHVLLYFLQNFYHFGFYIEICDPFESVQMCGVRYGLGFIFWNMDAQLFPASSVEHTIFFPPIEFLLHFCQKLIDHRCAGLFFNSFVLFISVSILSPISHFIDNCSFIVSLEIRQYESYNFARLFQN